MSASPPVLVAENITKSFTARTGKKIQALDTLSFSLDTGRILALVGPDGAGKSTLIRIIAGLLRPDSGQLCFAENSPAEENAAYHVGYMPQRFGLYEDLTVQENLDLYADLRGVSQSERESRYQKLLAMCGMEPFRQRLAGKLSGGMKQKLGLVCTLVAPPRLLLLDEPTVGVDPLSRRELWDIVERLAGETGMSVIVSTSYLDEAARCDEVMLFFEGKVLAQGTPESIRQRAEGMGFLARPFEGETPRALQAELLDAPGIIDAVPQGGAVRFIHGSLSVEEERQLALILGKSVVHPLPPSLEDSFMLLLHEQRLEDRPARLSAALAATAKDLESKERDSSSFRSSAHNSFKAWDMDRPVIETEHVSRLFGDFVAVNDVSFSVYQGEVFGLLGPNGAGKTTTFRMLCGLLPASKGTLRVAGVDVRDARVEARRRLGYVAQKFSLYGPLSVRENLEFFAGAYGLKGKRKDKRVREMVEDFSLEEHLHAPAASLPGGYKQRLAMAVGLLHEPAILFLDEPTSGADPLARRDFWQRITRLAAEGVTIIVTTHFMEEAEYCDRILIQDSGNMLALGTPAEIRALAVQASGTDLSQTAAAPGALTGSLPTITPTTTSDTASNMTPATALGLTPTMEDAFIHIVAKAREGKKENAA